MANGLPSGSLPSPGQYNLPSHQQMVLQFEGIFDRQYYTESGPLVRQLEGSLQSRLEVEHVICTSNPTVAWIMLLEAGLERRRLIAPATMARAFLEASRWTHSELTVCDIDADRNYRLASTNVDSLLTDEADGIVGVNPWGGAAEIEGLLALSHDKGLKLFLDSSQSLGSSVSKGPIGGLADAEVFALTPENILNGAGGACICTNDELLADRIRCMRGSGGVRRQVPVTKTVNGRMSEAQAAYALMSFEALNDNIARNTSLHATYAKHLQSIPGLILHSAAGVSASNYQQAVVTVDEQRYRMSALDMVEHLRGKSISARLFCFPIAAIFTALVAADLPGFAALARTGIELPLGSATSKHAIEEICGVLASLTDQTSPLRHGATSVR